MLFKVILVYYFSIVTANHGQTDFGDLLLQNGEGTILQRHPRDKSSKENIYKFSGYSCEHMGATSKTPFVVILLYKSAGRFIGMGSIINRKSVLTASRVVSAWSKTPNNILVLAGRLSPWWGKDSQVKEAQEILQTNKSLALIRTVYEFTFNRYVGPIKLVEVEAENYVETYTSDYAIFGIPRSSWDVPGDKTAKSARYFMQVETNRDGEPDIDKCLQWFPDQDFSSKDQICTWANFSFTWGCIGSPTIAITGDHKVLQIAVVTKTAEIPLKDQYHFHTKTAPYIVWLKSHSHMDYRPLK